MKKIIFILLLSLTIPCYSQNYLGISKVITGFMDTVNINQSVSYQVYVKNYGPAVFTGFFRLNTWADSTNAGNNFHFSRLDTLLNAVTLNVGDSVLFNTGDTYDLATYRVTGNVVVIWPKTFNPGWQTKDSVYRDVFVRGPAGINEHERLERSISLYPNPAADELNIKYNNNLISVEDVRILNNIGQCVISNPFTPFINLINLSPGLYTLELNSNKGKFHKRFIKE